MAAPVHAAEAGQRARLGRVALPLVIAAFVAWFTADAARASFTLENLVMVAPAAALAFVTCAVLAVRAWRGPEPDAAEPAPLGPVLALLALLAGLVLLMEEVGFDVGVLLFLLATPWLLGERRPLVLLAFALPFTALAVLGLQAILPFTLTTLVL
ncbi:hypothetical protein QMO56_20885 [Roseomonas sp. E05]|uniref:hypothetical protein n=1 Tax=Roseomonas sp. E05 TaxID=3046310 RepID=UPI0024BBDB73|nr:hypothetical protein [Roseomonas sp. E05]MDJ0390572.1 hypothetical protein [Roseomonas sp. E05]